MKDAVDPSEQTVIEKLASDSIKQKEKGDIALWLT